MVGAVQGPEMPTECMFVSIKEKTISAFSRETSKKDTVVAMV